MRLTYQWFWKSHKLSKQISITQNAMCVLEQRHWNRRAVLPALWSLQLSSTSRKIKKKEENSPTNHIFQDLITNPLFRINSVCIKCHPNSVRLETGKEWPLPGFVWIDFGFVTISVTTLHVYLVYRGTVQTVDSTPSLEIANTNFERSPNNQHRSVPLVTRLSSLPLLLSIPVSEERCENHTALTLRI